MSVMEEKLMNKIKLAKDSLAELKDGFKDDESLRENSEHSLLRLSSALKNIDKEINKLHNAINVGSKHFK